MDEQRFSRLMLVMKSSNVIDLMKFAITYSENIGLSSEDVDRISSWLRMFASQGYSSSLFGGSNHHIRANVSLSSSTVSPASFFKEESELNNPQKEEVRIILQSRLKLKEDR